MFQVATKLEHRYPCIGLHLTPTNMGNNSRFADNAVSPIENVPTLQVYRPIIRTELKPSRKSNKIQTVLLRMIFLLDHANDMASD